MSDGRILVIAPNIDLRKSLAFALEAEGYVVTTHAEILSSEASRGYDCVVLDHRAATGPHEWVLSFVQSGAPVVLLGGAPLSWLTDEVFDVVHTPVVADRLSHAVHGALAEHAPAPGTK